MSGSMVEVVGSSTTPRMGRRSMALADIDPKYVSQSGIWEASEVETSRGSIRIQHLTTALVPVAAVGSRTSSSSMGSCGSVGGPGAVNNISGGTNPRFPKLEECAHFHYDCVELPQIKIHIRDDPSKPISFTGEECQDKCAFSIEVVAGHTSWAIRRTHNNIQMLDSQLHRCVWDRTFSLLEKVHQDCVDQHNGCREFVTKYLARLNDLPTDKITCGTVLSWFELDNRGRHIVSSDDSAINTPAVAAACAVRKYVAQAADEISFEVGEMISVIDMPEVEESIWWRGKRGFQVGFFPRDYVQVIGDKVPPGLPIVPSVRKLQRLSVSSNSSSAPDKPVLRKHGKLIAFFRSFILSRPSRRRLKQSGILRERVFSCDLAEHLLNTGNEIPTVLKCCGEFIEKHGIVDGVYRLSGITSNIQKLRNAFDEDKIPNLEGDLAIKQDIHAVSSLLKMYFRELPNPLCTYQLYEKFVAAAKESDEDRLLKMRDVVHELPPPHYRTLEYLMKHLSRVALRSSDTGMTPKNMAIVWAPNLIRCRELEAGGVAALKGIGHYYVVTEYLIRHADLIFNDKLPANFPLTTTVLTQKSSGSRPNSLAISSPIKLMSLEEAQDRAKDDQKYFEINGGPSNLPPKYHTVIELPSRRGGLKSKRSPMGWKHFFSRNRSFSKPQRKTFTPGDITVITRSMPVAGPQGMQTNWAGRLRPVKSVESLVSSPIYNINSEDSVKQHTTGRDLDTESVREDIGTTSGSKSSPTSPVTTNVHITFHPSPPPPTDMDARSLLNSKTHNRSISHDSYFEFGEFRHSNNVYIDETLEEETMSQSSKLSMDLSSSEMESNITSPLKSGYAGRSKSEERERAREPFKSPLTPPPSAASILISESYQKSVSSEDVITKRASPSPSLSKPRPSKWRDSEVQTSHLKLSDVGVCTDNSDYSTNTREKSTGVDSSTFVSMDEELGGRYELDKNSSFDESSEMSTPDEPFVATNIIYSPLVNEASSSTEHSELIRSGFNKSSASAHKQSSNRSSNSIEDPFSTSSTNVCLFVCPLYEAGVTPEDFKHFNEVVQQVAEISDSKKNKDSNLIKEDPINVTQNNAKEEHNYENHLIAKIEVSNNALPLAADVFQPQIKEICHIYENERIYQNQPIAPIRKRTLTPTNSAQEKITLHQSTATSAASEEVEIVPIPKPKAKEPLPSTCMASDAAYMDKGEEHYANISESNYEGNIYEDIDSESERQQRESKYSGSSSCRYEAVGESSTSSLDKSKEKLPPLNLSSNEMHESSDDEYSANYESVRFQKIEDKLVAHHYSAIEDHAQSPEEERSKLDEKSQKSISSSSPSRTDDMVTYLEVQTPSFKLRADSLDEQKSGESEEQSSYEGVGLKNSIDEVASPDSTEGEIHFIDSPLAVDNPVYALETEGAYLEAAENKPKNAIENEDEDFDVSMNESISISLSMDEDKSPSKCENNNSNGTTQKTLKLLGRCNSAPLGETKQDFVITDIFRHSDQIRPSSTVGNNANQNVEDKNETNNVTNHTKLSLSKRFSEPSLLMFSNANSLSLKTDENNATAWKLADAKRLANRKQSVKELLSKFESRDSTPSPTNSIPQSKELHGPGLPKPASLGKCSGQNANRRINEGGSGRFQHHRFSVGDILLGQSVSESEDLSSFGSHSPSPKNSMIRSDTYPELRLSNLKVQSASKENLDLSTDQQRASHSSGNINEDACPFVPEKIQHAIRVAMSSVDMNDPCTRERIEKYKEERRTFLRQKITSGISLGTAQKSPSPELSTPHNSSTEGPGETASQVLNNRLNANDCSITITNTSTQSTQIMTFPGSSNKSVSSDSPRKRAFSEDVPLPFSNSYSTKTKSIKTESEFSKYTEETSSTTSQEEINVKEKIALWALQKKEMSKSTLSCTDISNKFDPNLKSLVKPILRREVTTSSIEISKCKLNASRGEGGGGKKIKDMAAFFEAKRF